MPKTSGATALPAVRKTSLTVRKCSGGMRRRSFQLLTAFGLCSSAEAAFVTPPRASITPSTVLICSIGPHTITFRDSVKHHRMAFASHIA
jgi:hypothetical protein